VYAADLEPILAVPNGPFRAYCGGGFTQGKPWAKLSCPFGARALRAVAVWTFGEGTQLRAVPIRANLICKSLPACGITSQRSVVRLDDDVHGHLTS
jgi:hypothetical protein